MVSRKSIDDFLSQKKLALIGVSRDTKQLANVAYRFLKTHGFTVYPVNPNADKIEGDRCYPNIKSLPEKVDGVVIMLPPEKTMKVLPEILEAGIEHVWLQQQTESPQAIQFCKDHNIRVVYGECIMMFTEPVASFHRLHRWGKKVMGKLPK
ncbi:MAG: CoA-binding protein [Ignavibacteriales bacterium]|nr:CoA-binding protein [Ignavibacteriales bacterium]